MKPLQVSEHMLPQRLLVQLALPRQQSNYQEINQSMDGMNNLKLKEKRENNQSIILELLTLPRQQSINNTGAPYSS